MKLVANKPFFSIKGTDENIFLNKTGILGHGWLSTNMEINCKNINVSDNITGNNLIANNSINIKDWILYQNNNKNLDFLSKIIDPYNPDSLNGIKYSFANQSKNISSCDIPPEIVDYKQYGEESCLYNTWRE